MAHLTRYDLNLLAALKISVDDEETPTTEELLEYIDQLEARRDFLEDQNWKQAEEISSLDKAARRMRTTQQVNRGFTDGERWKERVIGGLVVVVAVLAGVGLFFISR